jgi:hypothetical protein
MALQQIHFIFIFMLVYARNNEATIEGEFFVLNDIEYKFMKWKIYSINMWALQNNFQ